MEKGRIVLDVDGTIARRDCRLTRGMSRLLRELIGQNWRLFVVTGRTLENIEPRVLEPVRCSLPGSFEMGVFTCEGARRWRWTEQGIAPIAIPEVFPTRAREELAAALESELEFIAGARGVKLLEDPSWWEEALLVFKIGPSLDRAEIIARLESRIPWRGEALRVGAAGKTTIVVTLAQIHKGAALRQIRSELAPEFPVIYIADEFDADGNDAVALRIPGVHYVSVGPSVGRPCDILELGEGPAGTHRFLTILLRYSRTSGAPNYAVIESRLRDARSGWAKPKRRLQ